MHTYQRSRVAKNSVIYGIYFSKWWKNLNFKWFIVIYNYNSQPVQLVTSALPVSQQSPGSSAPEQKLKCYEVFCDPFEASTQFKLQRSIRAH